MEADGEKLVGTNRALSTTYTPGCRSPKELLKLIKLGSRIPSYMASEYLTSATREPLACGSSSARQRCAVDVSQGPLPLLASINSGNSLGTSLLAPLQIMVHSSVRRHPLSPGSTASAYYGVIVRGLLPQLIG
jgi:hypothetical protein